MIILGIDPGFATLGFGIINVDKDKFTLIDYGCIKTSAGKDFAERLETIYDAIKKILKKYQPDKVAVENIYFAKNVKTAIKVGEARGVILLASHEAGAPIFEFTPLQVKQALTSYGQAQKTQIQKMVQILLNLKELPKPDDAADALAIALTCAFSKIYPTHNF